MNWGERMLEVVRRCDRFNHRKSTGDCMAFHVGGEQYGVVRNDSWRELSKFSSVFSVDEQQRCVKLTDQLQSPHERTEKVNKVLIELRENQVFHSLKGWRNEMYPVVKSLHSTPIFLVERAAAGLFGIKQYGCHLNGYVYQDKYVSMWISRRSVNKPTFPGKLDNLAAGGLPVNVKVKDNMVKECYEEAGIPADVATKAKSVSSIRSV
jgi:hypothetical protein